MAALVTLEVAKSHLRVPAADTANDDDIQRKVEQATAIVLDYLKARAHKPAVIVSSSVASPTVITTEDAHGYVSGETVTIEGHDSTPSIDGTRVVTVLTSKTFTVPVAVTVGGEGGTALVEWDSDTVPGHVQASILLMLTHLHESRGDDMKADANMWEAIRRLLERSRDPAFA